MGPNDVSNLDTEMLVRSKRKKKNMGSFADLYEMAKSGELSEKDLRQLNMVFGKKKGKAFDQFRKSLKEAKESKRNKEIETGDIVPPGYYKGQLRTFTPEQEQAFKGGFQDIGEDSYLRKLSRGDEDLFKQMEAPAHRQFQEKLGQIGSRYSELAPGAQSATSSSGFQNSTNQASRDFAMDLASRRQDLQRQAMGDLQSMRQELLGYRPEEKFLVQKQYREPQQKPESKTDFTGGLLGGLAGAGTGFLTGGTSGAVAGGLKGFNEGYYR